MALATVAEAGQGQGRSLRSEAWARVTALMLAVGAGRGAVVGVVLHDEYPRGYDARLPRDARLGERTSSSCIAHGHVDGGADTRIRSSMRRAVDSPMRR